MDGIFYLFVAFLLVCLYFLPTIYAYRSKHPRRDAIMLLNILLGWTFIGWIIAVVWASSNDNKPKVKETSDADELEKLAQLKTKGVITETEFEAKKKKILGL